MPVDAGVVRDRTGEETLEESLAAHTGDVGPEGVGSPHHHHHHHHQREQQPRPHHTRTGALLNENDEMLSLLFTLLTVLIWSEGPAGCYGQDNEANILHKILKIT